MTTVDITTPLNKTFREHRRYTGDGLPSAPSGAPLPVGDPSSGVHNPAKSDIRGAFADVQTVLQAAVDAAEQVAYPAIKATWSALNALPGVRSGQMASVPTTDAGTHTDPVVGGTVPNSGTYSWSVSPAGWQRVDVYQNVSAVSTEVTAARQGAASLDARINLINRAKVWNAVDPMTISEIGLHLITNATNLPSGWPAAGGLTALLFVWQTGGTITRFLAVNSIPEAEWRSRNAAPWIKSSAYQIDAAQLAATYAYAGLMTGVNLNTLLDERRYIANGAYTNGPPGFGDTAYVDVEAYGNTRIQTLRGGTIMDRVWQRRGTAAGVFDPWYAVGGAIGGGTGFSIAGKTLAVIGDSLIEFGDGPERLAARFGMTVHKFGFGGCRMGYNPGSPNGYDKMSMYRIAENIASGDYTSLIAGAEWVRDNSTPVDDNTAQANAMAALDWSTVDYLLICFGTNDWTGNIGLNGTQVPDPTGADYDGALAYAIETIQGAHPALRIGVVSPIFRVRDVGNPSVNSDNEMLAGLVLPNYVEACGEVAKKYHIPWFDFYNGSGINRATFTTYLQDGTHPKTGVGYQLWAEKVGSWMGGAF